MSFYKILNFKELGDERGNLVAIEGNQDIPFEIKRVFYMYGTDSTMARGEHANRLSEFVMINVSGSSRILLNDGMGNEETVYLDKPRMGLYIPKMVWKKMYDFSKDSVILCLSNIHYDASEYIRDFDAFEKEMSHSK